MSTQELQANRFELVSRLTDDLAHEIKNPLHSMVINLEVLRRRVSSGEREAALDRATVIEHELQRLHRTVDQLLRLLRPEPEAQTLDVDQAMGELVPLLELQTKLAHIEFRYEPCGSAALVTIRRDAFNFAVLNLAEALLEPLRTRGGCLAITGECEPGEIRVRISAIFRNSTVPETTTTLAGILDTRDLTGSAHAVASDLVRDAGGRVLRDGSMNPSADGEFIVVIPTLTGG
jgi:signal transduction histidine kinase